MNRRNSTPPLGIPGPPPPPTASTGTPATGLKPTRRISGARHNVSLRIVFYRGEREIPAWALNMSRGGLRAIVEDEHLDVGAELEIRIGDGAERHAVRIVWTSPEPDGTIVGAEFVEPLPEGLVSDRGSQPSFPAVRPVMPSEPPSASPSSIPPPGDGE